MKKLIIAILIITILACGSQSQPSQPQPTKPPAACEPITFTGSGDDVVKVNSAKTAGCTTISMTHDGEGNFIVVPFDAGNERMMGYANEIGPYKGTARWDGKTALMEIDAGGRWTVKIE
jgi:hypothetical protein